ncbi:MAG TPA: hypothetical protein VLM11_06480 [Streptosporangiaceae bacterium]|nr:hypothetical protein [Streptosporangiaceae bacterium]
MLPPEGPQGNAGAGNQPPSAGEARPITSDTTSVGGGAIDTAGDARGAGQDGNGAEDDTGTLSIPAPVPSRTGVRLGRPRPRLSPLRTTGHALGRIGVALAGGAATVVKGRARSGPAGPVGQPVKVRSADIAGTVFARLTVLPAVLIVSWLIPGVLLVLAGNLLPIPMVLISVSVATVLTVNGLRVVPASWPRLLSTARAAEPGWLTWFGLLATVVVVAALTAWQLSESSAAVIVARDQGTYFQTGYWIAQQGSLPIPQTLSAFGTVHSGLNFASTGFLVRGTAIYPGVLPGLPLLLAGGFWVHGFAGAQAIGPVLGGLAMLAFAGLIGRLVGPQWAPAGALILGLCLPQQFAGRTSLAETALQIMLFSGLCLVADSVALRGSDPVPAADLADPPEARTARARLAVAWQLAAPSRWATGPVRQRGLAVLAGLVLSFALTISLESLVCLLPVIPFAAALVIGRRPQAAPFLSGLVVGLFFGVLSLYVLDRPLLDASGQTVALAGVTALWLVALSVVVFQLARVPWVRRVVPRAVASWPLRWLPEVGALLVVAALVWFTIRPYVQKVHGQPSPAMQAMIRALQRIQDLPIDPTRTYAEQTLYWVIWYIGLPTVLLGGLGLAVVVRRCLRALLTWRDPTGVWRSWGLPLAMICAGSVVVLWAPDIVPDQPWASRRLIFIAIPGFIAFGLWAADWLGRRAIDRGARPVTATIVGLFCVAAMLVPTAATTFGFGLSHVGRSGGLKPVAKGLALTRSGAGESAAVRQLCRSMPGNAAVIIVDPTTALEFAQVIRGMCDLPVASVATGPNSPVQSVIRSIAATGRRPVLVAASAGELLGFGGTPVRLLDLATTEEPHDLIHLPTALQRVRYQVWATAPAQGSTGP